MPFGLTEAEFTELQNILNDEARQREINEGYKELRDTEDIARRRDVFTEHEEAPPGCREIVERAPEEERG